MSGRVCHSEWSHPYVLSEPPLSFRAERSEVEESKKIAKIFGDSDFCRIFAVPFHENESLKYCGNSSVGRARPCQGRGREFESRFPLQTPRSNAGRFCLWGDSVFGRRCVPLCGGGRARSGSVHRQWCLWALSCTLLSGNGLQPGFGRSSVHMTESIMRSICTQEQRTWVGSNLPDPSWCISLFLFG